MRTFLIPAPWCWVLRAAGERDALIEELASQEVIARAGQADNSEDRGALPDMEVGPWDGGYCVRLRRSG